MRKAPFTFFRVSHSDGIGAPLPVAGRGAPIPSECDTRKKVKGAFLMSTLVGPTSHYFYSLRLKLHYVDWGNHDKPPLLLIHGGRDHARNWDWVAQDLRRDYHIIAPD